MSIKHDLLGNAEGLSSPVKNKVLMKGGGVNGNWTYLHDMTIATTLAKALQISSG